MISIIDPRKPDTCNLREKNAHKTFPSSLVCLLFPSIIFVIQKRSDVYTVRNYNLKVSDGMAGWGSIIGIQDIFCTDSEPIWKDGMILKCKN